LFRLGVALGLACWVSGCWPCPDFSEQIVYHSTVPNGSALVEIAQINTPAGSSFKYELRFYPHGVSTRDSSVLWRSSGCGPTYVFWVTDRLLELHLESEASNPKCADALLEARHTRYRWNDFEVKIVPIRGLYKRDLLTSGEQ
jgi:hypothetical protein